MITISTPGEKSIAIDVTIRNARHSDLVEDMVVTENFRGQGIGRILLADAEAWARQHGATRLQLLTDKENRRTLRFFQKKRWTTTRLICLRKAVGRDSR